MKETVTSTNPQEPWGNKTTTMQTEDTPKKMKAHRTPPEYTITDDDGEMISQMVQDYLAEDFDHAAHHK
jgi:hypothetical protein